MEGSLNVSYITRIAEELSVKAPQVAATAMLLAEGATVPFIAPLSEGSHRHAG